METLNKTCRVFVFFKQKCFKIFNAVTAKMRNILIRMLYTIKHQYELSGKAAVYRIKACTSNTKNRVQKIKWLLYMWY